ncbi:MAG: AraC family transcriptional regulator [Bacteroidales bacterium]
MEQKKILHIKNMVCPRCVMAVEGILNKTGIDYQQVELGQVSLPQELPAEKRKLLEKEMQAIGFELLEPGTSALISRLKTLVINQLHHEEEPLNVNFSTFLSQKLHHEYSYLSRLFSSVEGVTLEKFITRQKIEKVKELIFYDELSLSEIAFQMGYSSAAYLSTQFKKETGMTPSAFKQRKTPGHQNLDSF